MAGNVNSHRRAIYQKVKGPANKKAIRRLRVRTKAVTPTLVSLSRQGGDAGMVVAYAEGADQDHG